MKQEIPVFVTALRVKAHISLLEPGKAGWMLAEGRSKIQVALQLKSLKVVGASRDIHLSTELLSAEFGGDDAIYGIVAKRI